MVGHKNLVSYISYLNIEVKPSLEQVGPTMRMAWKPIRKEKGFLLNESIYPKKPTIPNIQHKKYPYLLKNMKVERINQVRTTDITYISLI